MGLFPFPPTGNGYNQPYPLLLIKYPMAGHFVNKLLFATHFNPFLFWVAAAQCRKICPEELKGSPRRIKMWGAKKSSLETLPSTFYYHITLVLYLLLWIANSNANSNLFTNLTGHRVRTKITIRSYAWSFAGLESDPSSVLWCLQSLCAAALFDPSVFWFMKNFLMLIIKKCYLQTGTH